MKVIFQKVFLLVIFLKYISCGWIECIYVYPGVFLLIKVFSKLLRTLIRYLKISSKKTPVSLTTDVWRLSEQHDRLFSLFLLQTCYASYVFRLMSVNKVRLKNVFWPRVSFQIDFEKKGRWPYSPAARTHSNVMTIGKASKIRDAILYYAFFCNFSKNAWNSYYHSVYVVMETGFA